MTVRELQAYFDAQIPKALSCVWDNDGLMCSADLNAPVNRVLCALDVTMDLLRYAAENRFDAIVSHHPLIFHSLGSIVSGEPTADRLLFALNNRISVFSYHTRFDALDGGINDLLAERLGLLNVQKFSDGESDMGRIGDLNLPMDADSFARFVKEKLGADSVAVSPASRPIRKVAVLGGAGKDFLRAAIAAGADAFVSGEIGYNRMADAADTGITLIEAGHFFTEDAFSGEMVRRMQAIGLHAEAFCSNRIIHF